MSIWRNIMALSSDEAYGLIGQIEEVRHEMALAQAAQRLVQEANDIDGAFGG